MSDSEFEVMDELYFVQPYSYLAETLGWEDERLLDILQSLYEKGYIKCLDNPDTERFGEVQLPKEGKGLYFLATKNGLMAHNTL